MCPCSKILLLDLRLLRETVVPALPINKSVVHACQMLTATNGSIKRRSGKLRCAKANALWLTKSCELSKLKHMQLQDLMLQNDRPLMYGS